MKIFNLKLKNYKGFAELDLDFPDQNLVVLIGENGAGKSTLLDILNKLLSDLDYNLNGNKRIHISQNDIKNNTSFSEANIKFISPKNTLLFWGLSRKNEVNSNPVVRYYYTEAGNLISFSREKFIRILNESFTKFDLTEHKPVYLYFESDYKANPDDFISWYKELVLFESYLKSSNSFVEYSLKEAVELAIRKFTGIDISATIAENFKTIKPVFQKRNVELDFSNLSDGEKRVIGIIGKIVSYFVISFKSSRKKLLDFQGIILIDEIEQHLHPIWQRNIIPELAKTFPFVQFIITTHSPQVISNLSRDCVLWVDNFNFKKEIPHTMGRDINSVLYDLFNLTKRPEQFQMKIDQVYELLDNGDIGKAKSELNKLAMDLGENDVEIKRIQTQIELME